MSGIVIVGAGPAGATAAIELACVGVPSILLDDNAQAGGQIFRAAADGRTPLVGRDARGEALRAALLRHRGVIDHRAGHELVGLFADRRLWVVAGNRSQELRPEHLVLATGAVEVSVPLPGWTLPGVYTLGGLQALAKSAGIVPAGRVVLGGAGPLLYLVAAQLVEAGVEISAVIDAAGRPDGRALAAMARVPALLARGLSYEFTLRRRGVRIMRRAAIVGISGAGQAQDVVVAALDGNWCPLPDGRVRLPADVVAMGFGVRANTELTQVLGCEHVYDAAAGGWRVVRNNELMTSIDSVYAIGDGAGIGGAEAALAQGVILAAQLAQRLGVAGRGPLEAKARTAARRLRALGTFRRGLVSWSGLRPGIFGIADAQTIVCRCEDVTAGELDAALVAGMALPRGLKMHSRAGMGLCQGRTCTPAVQHRLARHASVDVATIDLPTVRVPLRPVSAAALAALAGQK